MYLFDSNTKRSTPVNSIPTVWQPGIKNVRNQEELDQEQLIEQVVTQINRLGLRTPTLIALGTGHPFTFLSSQLLWIAQPVFSLFMPSQTIHQLAQLLEKPSAVHALAARLASKQG